MSRANDDIKFWKEFAPCLSNNYPERVGIVFIVEINWFFKIAFFIISQFLSQRTVDKVRLLKGAENLKDNFEEAILMIEQSGSSDF